MFKTPLASLGGIDLKKTAYSTSAFLKDLPSAGARARAPANRTPIQIEKMEGETYDTISRLSEPKESGKVLLNFIQSNASTEGMFVLLVNGKLSKYRYLVSDVSGQGVLNTSRVPEKHAKRFVESIKKKHRSVSLTGKKIQVIGTLETTGEAKIIHGTEISLFSHFSALKYILNGVEK